MYKHNVQKCALTHTKTSGIHTRNHTDTGLSMKPRWRITCLLFASETPLGLKRINDTGLLSAFYKICPAGADGSGYFALIKVNFSTTNSTKRCQQDKPVMCSALELAVGLREVSFFTSDLFALHKLTTCSSDLLHIMIWSQNLTFRNEMVINSTLHPV